MAPVLLSTPALVISTSQLGESDLLVTLFSLKAGKLKAVAKGAKRSKKRFMNALEPFTEIIASLAKSRPQAMWRLDSVSISDNHETIRADYPRFVLGNLCLELIDLWHKEEVQDRNAFDLTRWYLAMLGTSRSPLETSLIFQTRLLKHAGLLPELTVCSSCGNVPATGPVCYARGTGEIFCRECKNDRPGSLSLGTLRCLEFLSSAEFANIDRLRLASWQLVEGWHYIKHLHCHHLGREPVSYRFVEIDNKKQRVNA
ncbi:MAG: DNA repair protein RecO [Thermodesulfatator sp.]|nr:MAG: DNA repair protein RecO [Thermodesulfatator sp.]